MFSKQFLEIDVLQVAKEVEERGLFVLHGAIQDEFLQRIVQEVSEHTFSINRNWITGVYANRQYYLTHLMACSQSFTDLATSSRVMSICDAILGESYRLKAMRYYETYGKHYMQWHTDNKVARAKLPIPGLIFIFYVEDVEDGEFQYIAGSQRWSGEMAYSDYSEEFIEALPPNDVVSVKAPKGSIIIYNTYGIHRARPVESSAFVRKSVFFQVDSRMDSAEPALINPAFIRATDPKTLAYLGFSLPTEASAFPTTGLATLPIDRLSGSGVGEWLLRRVGRRLLVRAPEFMQRMTKRVVNRNADTQQLNNTSTDKRKGKN